MGSFFGHRNGNFASRPVGHDERERLERSPGMGMGSDSSTSSLSTLSGNSEMLGYQNYLLTNCINAALPEQSMPPTMHAHAHAHDQGAGRHGQHEPIHGPGSNYSSRTLPTSQRSSALSSNEMVSSLTLDEKKPKRKGKAKWFQFS